MPTRRVASGSWDAAAASVPQARRLVREHLRASDAGDLVDSAELVVTELVTNVVLHVGGRVRVDVAVEDGEALLEVHDGSVLAPQLRVFSATSSTGRGMRLVHSLAAEHGLRANGSGKTIWVRLTPAVGGRDDEDLAGEFADVDWLAQLDAGRAGGSAAQAAVPVALVRVAPSGPLRRAA